MLKRSLIGLVCVIGLLALPSAASAANSCDVVTVDKTWEGDLSSNWFTAGNWAPSGQPTSTNDVCIPAVNPNPNPVPVIGSGAQANAASIESSQPVQVNAGTLRIASLTQSSLLHDDLNLGTNTTLNNLGSLTVQGDLDWGHMSTITGAGTTTIASGATLTASGNDTSRTLDTATLRIDGTATLGGQSGASYFDTYLENGAKIDVGSGGTLDLQDDQRVYDDGGGPLLHVFSGGTLTRSSAAGTTYADVQIPVDNDGTTGSSAGVLRLSGGSGLETSTGQFSAATGAAIDFAAGTHQLGAGASFAGAGTIRVSGGAVNTSGAVSSAAATLVELSNSTLSNAGTMTVNGSLDWGYASTIAGAGTTTIASGATLTASGNDTYRTLDTATLRIDGTATLDGQSGASYFETYLENGAKIDVGSGGTLDLQDDQRVYDDGGGPLLHVFSGGTLTRTSAAGTTYADVQIPVDNDGTTGSSAGVLRLAGGSGAQTSTGQFSAATGAAIDFAAGTHQLGAGASFAGAGTIRVSGGAVNTSGAVSSAAATLVELSNSTLSNAGTMTVNGSLDWGYASTIAGAGTTTIASGATLTASGNDTYRYLDTATLRIDGTATLDGQSGATYFDTYLENGAKIDVGSGGTLDLQDDQRVYDDGGGPLLHVFSGGTLTRTSAAGTTYADVQIPVDNDGTTGSSAGVLRLAGGSGAQTSTGQFSAATGAAIDFAAGTHQLGAGASFAGAGTIRVSGGAVNTSGAVSSAAATLVELSNSTLSNAGTMTVNGRLDWGYASTIAGAGTTTIASGATLTASGNDTYRYLDTATLRIDGTATLDGQSGATYFDTYLENGAKIDVGSGGTLDLQDNQRVYDFGGGTLLHVLSGGTLTRTSAAGMVADLQVPLTNDGTIRVDAGTLNSSGTFTNYNQTSDLLSGGVYVVRNGSVFQFTGADVNTNGADITLSGVGSKFFDGSLDGLRHLNTNNAAGKLRLRNGRNFTRTGAFTNNGLIDLAPTTKFTTTTSYTQGAGGTLATDIAGTVAGTSYGQLVANTTATLAGTLDADVSAYPPQTGDFFDVVVGASRTGTFSTVTGNGFKVNYLPDRVRLTPPELTISDRSVNEGDTGTVNARFTVDLSSPSPGTVTVDYATSNVSAKSPGDYTAKSGTLTFTPGQTQKFIDVPVKGETRNENTETFNVNLSSPQLAEIADPTGIGRIIDNDPTPTLSIGDSSRGEGGASETLFVTLSAASGQQVKVDYATANGSATAPGDYPTRTGTLTFNPGQTSKPIRVPTVQDTLDEADETFTVELTNPVKATIADGSGTATITDNDPAPSLSITDSSRSEGGSALSFDVTLSAPSGQQVKVDYATANGSATAPADYTAKTGTLTFTPGQTTKSVTVSSVQDTLDEADETFTVELSGAVKATIADPSGLGTITDDDPTPSLSINDVSRSEGTNPISLTVTLSAASGRSVTVDYATADGSAVAPGDYTTKAGTLTFTPGQTSKIVTVNSVEDVLVEPDETFTVGLTNPTNATISDPSGTATIVNDD